jgi:CCR4-NOT transcriptional regulation complex NOT5 subunit
MSKDVLKSRIMYGCDIEEFKASVKQSLTYQFSGGGMVVASLMSDAQELMARDDVERASWALNKAKALLFDIMEDKMSLQPSEELTYTRM